MNCLKSKGGVEASNGFPVPPKSTKPDSIPSRFVNTEVLHVAAESDCLQGFLTGGTQAAITYPTEYVKTQLQLQSMLGKKRLRG